MKIRMTLALTAMGALVGCGPIDVNLDGDGDFSVGGVGGAYASGGQSTGVGGGYSTGGGPTVGGAYAMGGQSTGAVGGGYSVGGGPAVGGGYSVGGGPAVGGAYSVGGSGGYSSGGSGAAPGEECWTEEVGSANGCIDNDVFLGRAFERCDLQGASLASISYTHMCDGFTSSMVTVSCCPISGAGGAVGTGGTGTGGTNSGGASTGGTDATTGGASTGGTDATTGGASTGGTDATTGGASTGGTDSGGWSAGAAGGYGPADGTPR